MKLSKEYTGTAGIPAGNFSLPPQHTIRKAPPGPPASLPADLRDAAKDGGGPSVDARKDASTSGNPKQWYSRGYLPHLDYPGLIQFITFRLVDSVPKELIQRWREELNWHITMKADDPVVVELAKRIERYEDAGHGACWLRQNAIAEIMENTLLQFDGARYRLIAWCIMPNHVHVLIETMEGFSISDVVHSWKSYSGNMANKALGRKGIFWMREYYDRFIRDEAHFHNTKHYIEENPVKASLVSTAEKWRWSSSHRQSGLLGAPASLPAGLEHCCGRAARDGGGPRGRAAKDGGGPSGRAVKDDGGPSGRAARDGGGPSE